MKKVRTGAGGGYAAVIHGKGVERVLNAVMLLQRYR